MKHTIKALFIVSLPVIAMALIFNATILKEYAKAKTLEKQKMARLAAANVSRMPAVLAHN